MPGGYMHLESMGDMDDYLIVQSYELTFFKSVYSQHTNFSQELMDYYCLMVSCGIWLGKHTFTIPRNGDLALVIYFLEVVN